MTANPGKRPRSRVGLTVLASVFLAVFVGLIALGVWQLQRRTWKLDLIQRVEARVHAPPAAAPGPDDWAGVDAARDEYKHVALDGRYLPGHDTLVQAVTELGAGFWLISPFRTGDGSVVLVNRGFVPNARSATPAPADARVTGLLRLSEPGGGFLRKNDPGHDRWYSRDVAAIAAARGLQPVAPYFVDADRGAALPSDPRAQPRWPVGGLTVIKFVNNHMQYALTWFVLALMVAAAGARVAVEERRLRRARRDGADTPAGTG